MAAKAASPPEGFDVGVSANRLVGTEEIELVARHQSSNESRTNCQGYCCSAGHGSANTVT
jgi:hypothetical protein